MNKFKKVTVYVLILLFTVFTLVQAVPNTGADTQSGFILASAGEDGQLGTDDDIVATHLEPAVAKKPANISTVDAVASADKTVVGSNTEPKPLRQPNSDEIPIYTAEDLAKIGIDPKYPLSGKYILMANIDLSGYSNWTPIGNESKPFTGQFDGNGLKIKNLTINRPNNDYQGLFGYTNAAAKLTNITLENVNINGNSYVGGLVGYNDFCIITNCYITGNITGNTYTGGLVGINHSTITNSQSTCNVTSNGYYTGGLVGGNYLGTIKSSYFVGSVTGIRMTGGLVGENNNGGTIINSYSIGSVTGNYYVGGLIGYNNADIKYSYSASRVRGNDYVGGLTGASGIFSYTYNSYWDIQTSGLTTSPSGTGKTTAEMKAQSTFVGWDFTSVWAIDEGKSYPYLRANEQIPHPGTN